MESKYNLWLYSGVLGVAILWSAMLISMRRAGLGLIDTRPLSFLGINPSTKSMFSFGLLASSVLFTVFAFQVKRIYAVKNRFLTYFLLGQAGQIIAAVTPYGMKSNYRLIHTIAAFALAFSLPLLIREFYRSQIKQARQNVYHQLYRLELMTFIVGMGIFTITRGIAPLGETLPAIGFHVWIICLTVLTHINLLSTGKSS